MDDDKVYVCSNCRRFHDGGGNIPPADLCEDCDPAPLCSLIGRTNTYICARCGLECEPVVTLDIDRTGDVFSDCHRAEVVSDRRELASGIIWIQPLSDEEWDALVEQAWKDAEEKARPS